MTLRRRADFVSLQKQGRRISPARWMTINYIYNDGGQLRCGWTIPRQVGPAVIRNRIKRWCRVITRRAADELSLNSMDLNVFIRPTDARFFKELNYEQFKTTLEQGLRSIRARP